MWSFHLIYVYIHNYLIKLCNTYLWWENGLVLFPLLGTSNSPMHLVLKEVCWGNSSCVPRRMAFFAPSRFAASNPYRWESCLWNYNAKLTWTNEYEKSTHRDGITKQCPNKAGTTSRYICTLLTSCAMFPTMHAYYMHRNVAIGMSCVKVGLVITLNINR